MFEKPQSTHVLGLDIDAFSLKGAAIHQTRSGLKLEKLFDFPIEFIQEEEGNVKPLYTSEQQDILQSTSDNTLIVTTANTQDILVRPLELKLTKDKDIEAALLFQAEPLLPYPVENAVIDKIVLSKEKESSQLAVFAIRKDHLSQHLKQWNALDIEPEVISASPLGLVLFANEFISHSEPYFIVHLGIENSCAVLMDQNQLVTTQAIPAPLYPLIELLMHEKGLDKSSAYTELLQQPLRSDTSPQIKQALDTIRMSATRTLFSLAKQLKGKEIKEMVITGPGASVEELCQLLCTSLNKTLLIPNGLQGFGATKQELLLYALPIGEALSALPKCKDQINFRQHDFAYPEPWKRLKQPVSFYVLLCFGVALALFIFGKAYVSYQEGEMRQQYLNLLQVMNKPYKDVEHEFIHKYYPSNTSEEIRDVASLDAEEIKQRLSFLENEIQSIPQTYPLQPNVPLVTDMLAWISSHPNFIDKASESADTPIQAMHVESFSYNMVKRPDPTKKQDRYQVKVELEFSSPVPKMAREFHDALIAPNDMVDPKGEIKWNSSKDRYRTSFYLKDKTVYPGL
jgi:type IV pilus assembly protein PilM